MKNRIYLTLQKLIGLLFIFILLLLCPAIARCDDTPDAAGRILFLSSYSYAWDTVQIQIEGIKDGLSDGVTIDYEFMDTKRLSSDEDITTFHDYLKYKLDRVKPYDVILVGDDSALLFALQYREELFSGIPIIFEGINDESLALEAGKDPLITGILEKLSFDKNIDFAKSLYPDAKNVVAILDDSVTGNIERTQFYSHTTEYPDLTFSEINTSRLTSDELTDALNSLDTDTILIYIVMTEDASGKQYTSRQAVDLISNYSKIPAFRMVSGGIGDGLLGGNIVSMKKSGELAAQMACKIIAGIPSGQFDVMVDSPNIYYVDEAIMRKFHLDLSLIPDGATVINHKESFFEKNKEILLPAIIICTLLLLIMFLVFFDNIKHRRLSKALAHAKEDLETAYYHDSVTDLPNRVCLKKDLKDLSHHCDSFALMMVDIDNFKYINDTYGHNIGDEALIQIGERMSSLSPEHLAAYRFAGDEFMIIAKASADYSYEDAAKECLQIFSSSFDLRGITHTISASIGIAIYPDDTKDIGELQSFADGAMYGVKKASKNGYYFYRNK